LDLATRGWSAVAPPPTRGAGPFTSAYTGTGVVFRAEESVVYDLGSAAWREAPPGLTVPPDRVAWTQHGYGLFLDGVTLVAYNPTG
jgi:hypothetical protein